MKCFRWEERGGRDTLVGPDDEVWHGDWLDVTAKTMCADLNRAYELGASAGIKACNMQRLRNEEEREI